MLTLPKLKQPFLWLLLLIVANGLLLAKAPPELRYGAAVFLLAFLPGWMWTGILALRDSLERFTLAVGLSLALTIVGAMLAVYVPGPLSTPHLLLVINSIVLAGLAAAWRRQRAASLPSLQPPRVWPVIAALILLALALRLPRLGYAEFHEDEAEALMLGVRLMQGEDYALFLHRKGPAQMLLPVSFWLLSGRITEAWARFPFALSSLFSVLTLFLLGRRWFNWPVGAAAALLWALNGYAIAFGRMVQYQALIFFLGPLALYCLYLVWQERRPALQFVAAILLAACLLAHFDALLLLPAAGYLAWRAGRLVGWKRTWPAATLLLALLGAFYVPYVLDPEFGHTAAYLAESRVRPGLLYNNLDLLRRLDQDYSSHFYLPLVGLGLAGFVVMQTLRLDKRQRWLSAGLGLLLLTTVGWPDLWRVGSWSLAVAPWLLLGLLYFWFVPAVEIRAAWLTFGAPFIGYVFLVNDPRTHLYILYPGALLLAGAGWVATWRFGESEEKLGSRVKDCSLPDQMPNRRASSAPIISVIVGALLLLTLGAVGMYHYLIFLQPESRLSRLREGWEGSAWEVIYDDVPGERAYFGYPKREGWKAIGALRAQGLFPGDFRSINEDFIIPIWYNYGQARSCYTTPAYYFLRAAGPEIPANPGQTLALYEKVGQVQREEKVRLHLFARDAGPAADPTLYILADFEPEFDRLATPQRFVQQAEPAHPVGARFGPAIEFLGYDIYPAEIRPGQILYVDLYWAALTTLEENYRAFVHLTDGNTLWAQQDDDPICRLPTAIWRPGQRGMGQFRLTVSPETPPGRYPLIIGLYRADTLERLEITGGAGQVGDDFLWLADIEVVE